MKKNFLLYVFALIFLNQLYAQLSPGDLSNSHKNLEGLSNCTKCHEIGEKISANNCLSCHIILKERKDAGKGLHANTNHLVCESCHSEHHGREFKLIYWPEGQNNFKHQLAGYKLEGKHSQIDCHKCHNAENIKNIQRFISQKKDPNKTFLGLSQECLSCHYDEHRGQMSDGCKNCHIMQAWKPAPKFNHDKTRFKLTGLHATVTCDKCHQSITDNKYKNDNSFLKFAGLPFNLCTDCHRDPHQNRFGTNCQNCHNTSGWKNYVHSNFNHDLTRYPLKGKHKNVSCEECHNAGKSKKIIHFNECRNCHNDYHLGQFVHRKQKGACEECHTVQGFTPANFTITEHNDTKFALKGAHLAIPCIACHPVKLINNEKTYQFKFESTTCISCHNDPHDGQVSQYLNNVSSVIQKSGCEYCHRSDSWQRVLFDHSQTNFLLEGKHKDINCSGCHRIKNSTYIKFKLFSKECSSCHLDIHRGQFANPDQFTNCAKCHIPHDWYAEKFNHNVHSDFKLEGAHVKVSCQKCHKIENIGGEQTVRYKPINSECAFCHSDKPNSKKELTK